MEDEEDLLRPSNVIATYYGTKVVERCPCSERKQREEKRQFAMLRDIGTHLSYLYTLLHVIKETGGTCRSLKFL